MLSRVLLADLLAVQLAGVYKKIRVSRARIAQVGDEEIEVDCVRRLINNWHSRLTQNVRYGKRVVETIASVLGV